MTSKDDFSEDEWTRIVRAPFVVGLAVSLSDPGGPIEAGKEQMAAIRNAMNPPSREQLLTEVALDVQDMTQQRENPLSGYRPAGGGDPREALLEELRATREVIVSRATAEEHDESSHQNTTRRSDSSTVCRNCSSQPSPTRNASSQ